MATKTMRWTSALLGLGTAALLSACFNNGQEAPAGGIEDTGGTRPKLEKSMATPKDGESPKPAVMTTSDGEFVLRDGKWQQVSGPDPLMKESILRQGTGWITDIKVVAGSTSGTACPSGYIKLDGDLNRRAGGKWIFFCYKTGTSSQAINLNFVENWAEGTYGDGPGAIHGIGGVSNGDMNQGAAGDFVFGNYLDGGRGQYCAMAGIGIITDAIWGHPFIAPAPPWSHLRHPIDLNSGAGGDFIYMIGRYHSMEAYYACTEEYQ